MSIVGLGLLGGAVLTVTVQTLTDSLMRQTEQRMAVNVSVARSMLEQYGKDFSVRDNKLYIRPDAKVGSFSRQKGRLADRSAQKPPAILTMPATRANLAA